MKRAKPLSYYLEQKYPFRAEVDDTGEYVVTFPDLRGCFTGSERLEDLPAMIREGSSLWLESMYDGDLPMPEPTLMDLDEPSGRFNLRLPSSLHGALVEAAERQGVSLNQYVLSLLSRGDAQARIDERLDRLEAALGVAPRQRVADERAAYTAKGRAPRASTPATKTKGGATGKTPAARKKAKS